MSTFDEQSAPASVDTFEKDENFGKIANYKELTIGDGKVRIKDGAIIVTDETGVDRILIGYLKDAF